MMAPDAQRRQRPAIVTVDDPGVSRAVARDLRRRYGERHRIVRAESGEAALDALRQMKLRGEQVAVIEQIADIASIAVRTCTEITEAHGDGHLERLTLQDGNTGGTEIVDAQRLFVFVGAAPLTGWLDGVLLRDQHGFVLAGPDLTPAGQRPPGWPLDRPPYHLETSVPGVFVAGDVRAESPRRVASAVGEGAMAVMLVHRYLERL